MSLNDLISISSVFTNSIEDEDEVEEDEEEQDEEEQVDQQPQAVQQEVKNQNKTNKRTKLSSSSNASSSSSSNFYGGDGHLPELKSVEDEAEDEAFASRTLLKRTATSNFLNKLTSITTHEKMEAFTEEAQKK